MIVPRAPDGVSLHLNMGTARHYKVRYKYGRGALLWFWFYEQVRNGGPWDYKKGRPEFEDFGNFHYGAVGTAAGFSSAILHRAAGAAQFRAGTTKEGVTWPDWFTPPYGDDKNDQIQIAEGIKYAICHPL